MNEPNWGRLKTEKDALQPPDVSAADGVLYWQQRAFAAEDRLSVLLAAVEPLRHIWIATLAMNGDADEAVLWSGETIAGTAAHLRLNDIGRVIKAAYSDAPLDSSNEGLAGLLADALRYVRRREEESS